MINEQQDIASTQFEASDNGEYEYIVVEDVEAIDKQALLRESDIFNSKFSDENSTTILTKLIYLFNQGISFTDQEIESLFFRVTKLFQSNNPRLRQLTYILLKVITPQKFAHILIQSVTKDLISDHQFIKLQALKFLPFLQSQSQFINQIKRFIHKAILDPNLIMSNQALVAGIHLINNYPNLVGKWQFDIVQRFDSKYQDLQYHSLVLLHEIKKSNLPQFVKIMLSLISQPLQPMINLQIIKFIQEIEPLLMVQQELPIQNYLIQQANNADDKVFFQAAQLLIMDEQIQNNQLSPIIKRLTSFLSDPRWQVEKYASLHLIEKLYQCPQRRILLDDQIQFQIKSHSFTQSLSSSQKSLLIQIQLYGKNAAQKLAELFNHTKLKKKFSQWTS